MSSFVTYLICGFINPTFPQLILVEIDDCYTTVGLCRHAGGKPLDPKAQGRGGDSNMGCGFGHLTKDMVGRELRGRVRASDVFVPLGRGQPGRGPSGLRGSSR